MYKAVDENLSHLNHDKAQMYYFCALNYLMWNWN